jgi:hypothetical protein
MAVNYNEKILSTFGKRTVKSTTGEPDTISNGVFVVDPNKIVTEDETIIPRYVKQEDLVMYANITARLNPDNSIIENGDQSSVVTIGRVGVNFLNPFSTAPKDSSGAINFGDKKNKDYFTTEWSDYFTSNSEQGTFFDPETFGISNIDVTHNASLTPIIKIEFIDVQGRTLLERGDDPYNPYNIFYRFPYPLFTLTIKGYFGKAIEYPLSMTKTTTTFDSSTGNYVIRAEFLSRTFSVYNNFLMIYAYAAPYMYERSDVQGSYLGKRLVSALYQKQNDEYAKLYGKDTPEYLKHEFVKFPTILDLTRAQTVLGYETLSIEDKLKQINKDKEKALGFYGELDTAYESGLKSQLENWETNILIKNKRDGKYFLKQETIDLLKSDELPDLSMTNFPAPYEIFYGYNDVLTSMNDGDNGVSAELKTAIFNAVIADTSIPEGYKSGLDITNLNSLIKESLLLLFYTDSNDESKLNEIYYTEIYFKQLHKTISKVLSEYYDKEEITIVDNLGLQLKENLGYVPNMSNVLRILMNNMQVFLTMLNLVGLNASKQLMDDAGRRTNQEKFGEYDIPTNSPGDKRFYPFPNYFKKKFDTNTEDFIWEKVYPWTRKTVNWFEVQFVEEIYRALERLKKLPKDGIDSQTEADILFQIEEAKKVKGNVISDKKIALLTTLLVVNNLDFYNDQQSPRETGLEFIEKIMLFSTLGYINTAGDVTKINDITKLFVDHEFDLIERRYANKDANDIHDFYSNLGVFIGHNVYEGTETPTNYDRICNEFVNGTVVTTGGNYTNETNGVAIVNNINNIIPELKALLSTNYTISELRGLYVKVDNIINQATDITEFKKLYQYNPLKYKNRKNSNQGQTTRSLFFNGLDSHDMYDGFSDYLNDYSTKLQAYRKTSLVSANNGYFYSLNTENVDTLNFIVNGRVEANDSNSTPLTFALKTDELLKDGKLGMEFGGLNLDNTKKITSGTKYSKVRI